MIEYIDFSELNKIYDETDSIKNMDSDLELPPILKESIGAIGGKSFNNGLFTTYNENEVVIFTRLIETVFPQAKGRIHCFARDWLNRQFAMTNYEPFWVLQFDVNHNDITHIEVNLKDFYEKELMMYCEELCAFNYFKEWGKDLKYNQIAGYVIPLILGGKENIDNLQIIDAEVDMDILSQL